MLSYGHEAPQRFLHSAVSLLRWLSLSESSSDDDDGVGGHRFCGGGFFFVLSCFFFAGCFLEGLATGFFVPDDGFFVLGGIALTSRPPLQRNALYAL